MKGLLKVLEKVDHWIEIGQKILIALGVLAMVVINGAQVFCRFVLHSSIPWSEQISVMLFFILIMLGGNLAIRSDTETKIEVIRLKGKKGAWQRLVTDLICIVTLCIFLRSSFALMEQTMKFPQYLSSIQLNYVYIYVWLIIGFSLMIFDKVINVLKNAAQIAGITDGKETEQ